jgi:hypothetical protein
MCENVFNRYINLPDNTPYMNFKAIVAGAIIFLIGLSAYLTIPLYYPNYSAINQVYKENEATATVPPTSTQIVKTIEITPTNNSVIFFVNDSNFNVTIMNATNEHVLGNQQGEIGLVLSPGKYLLGIVNPKNVTQTVTYSYGVFPSNYINGFYYGLSVYETVLEIVTLAGAAIAFIAFLQQVVSRRKK